MQTTIIVIQALVIGVLILLYLRVRNNNHLLCIDFGKTIDEINEAWSQGRDEMVESFDAEYLDWADKQSALNAQVHTLTNDLAEQTKRCEDLIVALEQLREFRSQDRDLMIRQSDQIKELEVIRKQHEGCLPNLDLLRG